MKKVCAWCRKELGAVPPHSDNHSETIITHGICYTCANTIFLELGVELKAFLDSLAAPVVVVGKTGNIKSANKQAQALLQKVLADIEGYKGGNVFECAYTTPGGLRQYHSL